MDPAAHEHVYQGETPSLDSDDDSEGSSGIEHGSDSPAVVSSRGSSGSGGGDAVVSCVADFSAKFERFHALLVANGLDALGDNWGPLEPMVVMAIMSTHLGAYTTVIDTRDIPGVCALASAYMAPPDMDLLVATFAGLPADVQAKIWLYFEYFLVATTKI